MIELRWLVVPAGHPGAICLSGECRVLQFRVHGLICNDRFPMLGGYEWSEWQDLPVVKP